MSTDYKTPPGNLARGKPRARKRSRKVQQQIDWRRNRLSDYLVKGMSLADISMEMNIPYDTFYNYYIQFAHENYKYCNGDLEGE